MNAFKDSCKSDRFHHHHLRAQGPCTVIASLRYDVGTVALAATGSDETMVGNAYPEAKVVAAYRQWLVDNCLPKLLITGRTAISAKTLPAMYPAVKWKSYIACCRITQDGQAMLRVGSVSCMKPGQSLSVNIKSFLLFPGKRILQHVSRALTQPCGCSSRNPRPGRDARICP